MNRPVHPRIAETESRLLSGRPDIEGLCLALSDGSTELYLLRMEK